MNFRDFIKASPVVFADGAMGTRLQAAGLKPGEIPETWSVLRPDVIRSVHAAYFASGSDFVLANTFGANRAKYHGDIPLEQVVASSVSLAREAASAAGGEKFVALDVGPTGRLLKPSGDFEFDSAYDAFAEQIALGASAGADLVVIETMGDTYELKAAVLAAKENSRLPVLATVALDTEGKLLTGADVETVAALLEGLRVDALGFNCGLGPDLMLPYVERLARATRLPLMVKPNAGLPGLVDGETRFLVGPGEFASNVAALVRAGVSIVGGCCGTTPEHITAVKEVLAGLEPPARDVPSRTVVTSGMRAVEIPFDDSIIIGERINPTGKKRLREAYKAGDTAYILREAVAQVEAGSAILDINAGVPGIDEASVLEATVEAVQAVVDVPLQIDTADSAAMERAMRRYNGKCLVNSVNGKSEVMEAVFPLVAKYGGVVVALTLDENGIPATAEGRVAIARRILEKGAEYGLGKDDFIIDVLCLAVSADNTSANVILKAMKAVREELGVRTALGVSNISFGLPGRPALNSAFYTLALEAGLSAAIVNPLSSQMVSAYRAWRALTGRDADCSDWIAFADGVVDPTSPSATAGTARLADLIEKGLKADAADAARALVAAGRSPLEIIDGEIVPALEKVGSLFESGRYFLPQLLMSADSASAAFEFLRGVLASSGTPGDTKGPIVIATVKGDIHDIGKNIVRSLLENYGFRVIDLGRDVAPATIVETAVRENCRLVGLSALMTTTVGFMAETIKALKDADPSIRTFVGGAVLTEEYAKEIGATWYTKDAMASVRLAESFFA